MGCNLVFFFKRNRRRWDAFDMIRYDSNFSLVGVRRFWKKNQNPSNHGCNQIVSIVVYEVRVASASMAGGWTTVAVACGVFLKRKVEDCYLT